MKCALVTFLMINVCESLKCRCGSVYAYGVETPRIWVPQKRGVRVVSGKDRS